MVLLSHNLAKGSPVISEEHKKLVDALKKLEPGFLPYDIFVQIARLVALPIIEFVPLRMNGAIVEVLLLHRGEDDPIWSGEWHTPGTVVRATDNAKNIYEAFERILKDELAGTKTENMHFVGSILHKSKRGTEQAQVFWVEVMEEPKAGVFYPVTALPKKMMESQKAFIAQAVESFQKTQAIQP